MPKAIRKVEEGGWAVDLPFLGQMLDQSVCLQEQRMGMRTLARVSTLTGQGAVDTDTGDRSRAKNADANVHLLLIFWVQEPPSFWPVEELLIRPVGTNDQTLSYLY